MRGTDMFKVLKSIAKLQLVLVAFLMSSLVHAAGSPDVTVLTLGDTINYGAANGVRGYSVGTTSCNIGDAPLNWCTGSGCAPGAGPTDHPTIAQNLYRLKNGRLDQIGASWLKHGFVSLNNQSSACGTGTCTSPPFGGRQLGVGCTDPYGASLNGSRPLGRRSEVNATTGEFPQPSQNGQASTIWNQRIATPEVDLSAASNPGARYFVEGQYIANDDAEAGNGLNNASYREVSIAANFNLVFVGGTIPQKATLKAWPSFEPGVDIENVDVNMVGTPIQRFHVARKVTSPSPGTWHYEYAIHNMNSDRAADRFTVEFAGATTITGIGFKDIDSHSGEPYDVTDWGNTASANSVVWQAPAFVASPANGNALRWATQYNFWFDANRPPEDIDRNVLKMFKVGTPTEVEFDVGTPVMRASFEG